MTTDKRHILIIGNNFGDIAIQYALICHYPNYENNSRNRTRITIVVDNINLSHDFVFEYQELFDNSFWRIVDLTKNRPRIELHRPKYDGLRKDFVDVEWEFVIGHLSNPILQDKINRWVHDPKQHLSISLCYDNIAVSKKYAEKLKRRLPADIKIEVPDKDNLLEKVRRDDLIEIAKYLNYFYQIHYQLSQVPTELPEDRVAKAWDKLDDTQKMSNIYNAMSIPHKMELLGHDRNHWDTFYALTATEIEQLTAVEHNRWSVERLIQGFRPCSDEERRNVEEDLRLRLSDEEYAKANPVSLKKKYKTERNAHYDLCAFSELGVDETGRPVSRYDRDLTAVIPLIAKTYYDHTIGSKDNGNE